MASPDIGRDECSAPHFPFPQFPSNQTKCKVTMPVIRFNDLNTNLPA